MATPEETRERIKKMRDRIFNETDKNSLENNAEENPKDRDLTAEKPKGELKDEISTKSAKPTNLQAKLQEIDESISILSANTQKQISENDRIERLADSNLISSSQANKALKEELNELNRSIQLEVSSVAKRFSSANQKIEIELQNSADTQKKLSELTLNIEAELKTSADKLSKLENSVEERQNSLEENFFEKLQQTDDRISLSSADTQKQISEIAREFANKSSSLETEILNKIEQSSTESKSKINEMEQLVSDNIISSSQETKALKERIDELNRSLQLDINSVAKRLFSANEKIEAELKTSADKLSKLENSVEERQNSLEENFFEKLQQTDDRISLSSADTQKQISEIAREFANKSSSLETEILDKFEHISFHLEKLGDQVENQIGDLSTSLQKYVLSITDSQEDKIDIQAKKTEKNVASLKQEIFEHKRELKANIDKKIKESELKTNDYLSKKIFEVRDLLSGELKSLSEGLFILKNIVKEKNAEMVKRLKNNISSITRTVEKDRKHFNNQFEKVYEGIQSVEAEIVKEEDLVELFQNYTLNVNISDSVKPSKS